MINITKEILKGKIFIYSTDTIYGLGCDATNPISVERIKEIKQRDRDKPLTVIAPSIKWIQDNLIIDSNLKRYLPGPYTIILKKKNLEFLKLVSSSNSLGVRIPNCSFTKKIQESGVPFITTSVNLSGEAPALRLEDIKPEIKEKVDFILSAEKDEKLSGIPSKIIINNKEIKRINIEKETKIKEVKRKHPKTIKLL